jgi:hypothetical protein
MQSCNVPHAAPASRAAIIRARMPGVNNQKGESEDTWSSSAEPLGLKSSAADSYFRKPRRGKPRRGKPRRGKPRRGKPRRGKPRRGKPRRGGTAKPRVEETAKAGSETLGCGTGTKLSPEGAAQQLCRPFRTVSIPTPYPGLAPWASLCRPFGAWSCLRAANPRSNVMNDFDCSVRIIH